jgi:brefeldin A-resistance guanine nucleotide exchange factor 1
MFFSCIIHHIYAALTNFSGILVDPQAMFHILNFVEIGFFCVFLTPFWHVDISKLLSFELCLISEKSTGKCQAGLLSKMGKVKLQMQTGINAMEEEAGQSGAGYPSRTTVACMINAEIGAVLAVMRRNVRWGVHYMSDDDQLEHSLVQSLKALRRQIFSWHSQWHVINPVLYLQPFLDVIQSDETGAPITGVALSSVYKILTLDVIDQNTVNIGDAMHLVVDAVTSCRFEVTDPGSEEVVLMKILQVLLACVKSKASVMLSNQHICTIVNTCFRIVHQAGTKSELLQRIARYTMHELVRSIFCHLQDIDVTDHALVNGSTALKEEV